MKLSEGFSGISMHYYLYYTFKQFQTASNLKVEKVIAIYRYLNIHAIRSDWRANFILKISLWKDKPKSNF